MHDNILLFINVVEYGNFNKAAKQLGLSQSTITRRIQSIEETLKIQLLQRDCRTFQLTSAGMSFYNQVKSFLPECKVLLEEFHNECNNELVGTLKVGLPGISFVGLIGEFAIKYPKVNIVTRFFSHQIDLKDDDLNLAISIKSSTSNRHKVTTLETAKFKLYAGPIYIKKYGSPTSLKDFEKNHQFVADVNQDGSLATQLTAYSETTGKEFVIQPRSNVYVSHSRDLLGFADTNKYIIRTFDIIAAKYIVDGTLIQVLPEFNFGDVDIYLITPNRQYSRLESEFIQLLYQLFPSSKTV